MVIVRVVDAMGADLPQGDEGCQVVAQHIEALVCDGRLLARGDTKNWRFSEVRRPKLGRYSLPSRVACGLGRCYTLRVPILAVALSDGVS